MELLQFMVMVGVGAIIIAKLLDISENLKALNKPKYRHSNIITYVNTQEGLWKAYDDLIRKNNIHITSVSITDMPHAIGRASDPDKYMMAVSYDWLENFIVPTGGKEIPEWILKCPTCKAVMYKDGKLIKCKC